MADIPANPYTLNSLNGITFGGDDVGQQVFANNQSGSGFDVYKNSVTGPHYYTFAVSNAVDNYTAGFTANGQYYLPTFGTFDVSINGGPSETYFVHGFEDNGQGVFATAEATATIYKNIGGFYYVNSSASTHSAHYDVFENNTVPQGYGLSQHFDNDGSTFHASPATPPTIPGALIHGDHFSIGSDSVIVDPSGTSPGAVTVNGIQTVGEGTHIGANSNGSFAVSQIYHNYVHGHMGTNGQYYLPTFGFVKLTNLGNGESQSLYIHGYQDNGRSLLVSSHGSLYFQYNSGTGTDIAYVTPLNPENYLGIISDDSLTQGPQSIPLTFTNDGSVFVPPCYAEGSRILTARGEVAVEDLIVGDEAVLASGGTRPVIWIGSRRVRCDNHPRPHEVNPVRIKVGAFGDGLPVRDLVVSPGHAIYVDGVLIPAHSLVNGATIVQEQVERVRYFHIELDAHDVILAEGLACESYLDDGNREAFGNALDYTALHGRLDPMSWDQACAPMVAAGPQLTSVQARLHDRALAMGWTRTEEPNLCLLADGVAIAPVMAKANRYWFAVPACSDLVLGSNASILAQVMPGLPDTRQLGVAVSDLKLDGQPLDLAQAFAHGAHDLETHEAQAWRWTNGAAVLSAALAEPAMVEITVLMVAPTWQRQVPALRLVQAG